MKTIGKSTSVLELPANRNDGAMRDVLVGCLSTTGAEHRKLPKSMMIGKALLSGLSAHPQGCFTVRFTFALLTLARVSLSVSLFFSPLSLRRGVVVVCFEVTMGELLCLIGLRHVISGILAGGIPGFRMVLHSPSGMAW